MAWGLGTLPGFRSHGQTINPDMARVLGPWPWPKPWPKILDIGGCAWGKPVGSRRPGNPGVRHAANPHVNIQKPRVARTHFLVWFTCTSPCKRSKTRHSARLHGVSHVNARLHEVLCTSPWAEFTWDIPCKHLTFCPFTWGLPCKRLTTVVLTPF